MCMFSTPDMPAAPQDRQASRSPDGGNPANRQNDLRKRRLAFASSIFASPTIGAPSVASPSVLGA